MDSAPEGAFFRLNGTWLGLYGRDALAADATVPSAGSGFESFTLAHTEVDEIVGHLGKIQSGVSQCRVNPLEPRV